MLLHAAKRVKKDKEEAITCGINEERRALHSNSVFEQILDRVDTELTEQFHSKTK